jgi:hypothetical protein
MSRAPTATISAQPGPQTAVLQSAADICIFGGAAGCGKTFVLIVEALRHVGRVANFAAVFFRRTTPQITNPRLTIPDLHHAPGTRLLLELNPVATTRRPR